MATAPKYPCRGSRAGCAALVAGGGFCEACAGKQHKADVAYRGSASARGYDAAWTKLAARVRREEPICVRCKARGILTATDVAGHIVPIEHGGKNVRSNLYGLCFACNAEQAVEDKRRGRRR